jgi:xylan 1,4-beta-xylosidase
MVAGAASPVSITVDAAEPIGPLRPIYRFFGADEPNYAYLPDGKRLLGQIGRLGPAQTYFRTHNLMVTGDGTPALKWGSTNMYTEDAEGEPVYDWTIVDRIFDAYLASGVKPYVQIGFMPKALSTHPEPYQHQWRPGDPYRDIFTGWSYPPKDYHRWRELVYRWVRHCLERYGRAEVEQWYWQVWNEANPADGYWRGTPEEFRKLHDYAIDGVRRALPTARVGGPDTAGPGGAWMREFLDHVLYGTNHATGQVGTPLDFASFHAKGDPTVVDGQVRMGIAHQLRDVDEGFTIIASYPQLRSVPVVIGECDPDGCAACSAAVYPQNGYRNTALYASYTAASFARIHQLADRHGVSLEGALSWAFEFEDQPIFAGFRVLATTGGITLPVFNVFRMFGRMSGQRLGWLAPARCRWTKLWPTAYAASGRTSRRWRRPAPTGCPYWSGTTTTTPGPGRTRRSPAPCATCRCAAASWPSPSIGWTPGTATRTRPGSSWGHRRSQPLSSLRSSGRPVSCRRSTGHGRWRYATAPRRYRCGYHGRAYPC